MKTAGLIGGVGPESTIEYYRFIVEEYRKRTTDGTYPLVIINSIELSRMIVLVQSNDTAGLARELAKEIEKLAAAGSDFGAMCSNTPHLVFDELQRTSRIPLISIVEATRERAKSLGLARLGLFGSGFTMKTSFYQDVFSRDGIRLVVPSPEEQAYIHNKYMNELLHGVLLPETRDGLLAIVDRLKRDDGIEGLILGGTELPLILRDVDRGIPFLDTTRIHVDAIVKEMLS